MIQHSQGLSAENFVFGGQLAVFSGPNFPPTDLTRALGSHRQPKRASRGSDSIGHGSQTPPNLPLHRQPTRTQWEPSARAGPPVAHLAFNSEGARRVVQLLADVFANGAHCASSARVGAGRVVGFVMHVHARQFGRERRALGGARMGFRRRRQRGLQRSNLLFNGCNAAIASAAWNRVRIGQAVNGRADLTGAVRLAAKVVAVDRVMDAASASFGVRLELPNPGLRMPAGVRCIAEFADLESLRKGKAAPRSF